MSTCWTISHTNNGGTNVYRSNLASGICIEFCPFKIYSASSYSLLTEHDWNSKMKMRRVYQLFGFQQRQQEAPEWDEMRRREAVMTLNSDQHAGDLNAVASPTPLILPNLTNRDQFQRRTQMIGDDERLLIEVSDPDHENERIKFQIRSSKALMTKITLDIN